MAIEGRRVSLADALDVGDLRFLLDSQLDGQRPNDPSHGSRGKHPDFSTPPAADGEFLGLHLPGKLVPLVLAGLLAVAVSWADARLANTARLAAKEIHSRYRASKSTLWFTGHWGFQYYMESYGFKPYDTQHPRIGPSDVLIVPLNNLNLPPSFMRWYSKCAKFDVASSRLLATMHPAVEAGFYTSEWGLLPFAVGPVPDERYFIASGAVVNEGGKGDITDIYGSDKK